MITTLTGVGLVDSAIYVGGQRRAAPSFLDQTCEAMCGGVAWIGLHVAFERRDGL